MFDSVRSNKRTVQVVLALIILPFAFWGVESYIRNVGSDKDVASVGNSKISLAEFQQSLREQQDRLRPALGGRDPAMLDSPEMRRAVLDNLIQRRLLGLYAGKAHLAVGDQQLASYIAAVPALQVDGKFSPQRYESLIAAQGMSKTMFEANVRQDLMIQQALVAVGDASLAGNASSSRWLGTQMEEREISEAALRPERYLGQVKVSADTIKAYYEANLKRFELPEQLRAEYLVLSRDQLAAQTTVSDEDVKAWYQSHADRYKQAEERRASHVLIALAKNASADQAKAAEAKAAEVLAQAKKAPADFARLAKQYSQDPGSAEKGGDLDWFGRGAMVKPFEEAVFALKDGQVSDVVRSDFGLHVIKLTGIRAERNRPLDEVKGEIVAELKAQTAAKKYAELAEGFSNTVYEQADSLKPAIEKFKLAAQQSDWLVKGGAGAGPFANAKLVAALFADDAIKNKRNTEAIEIAPNVLVAARVLEHKPAAQQPLATVAPTIEKFLASQEAVKLAVKDGEEKVARLNKGEKADIAWGAPRTVTRAVAPNLPPDVVRAVFQADAARLPAYAGVAGPGGYALVRVSRVKPFVAGAEETPQVKALRAQYARLVAEEELLGWIAALTDKYPVAIDRAVLERKEK
ncbi:MAG TPA: SurA N-terminal domain-containing protein [Rhodocyclaceae bacterium]|nr:SurA N-terminal domain-containing protein [Rhodocyclaceae bacterium]